MSVLIAQQWMTENGSDERWCGVLVDDEMWNVGCCERSQARRPPISNGLSHGILLAKFDAVTLTKLRYCSLSRFFRKQKSGVHSAIWKDSVNPDPDTNCYDTSDTHHQYSYKYR